MTKTILVTGAAGFIGFHTTLRLLDRGCRVVGVDNMNDYYDVGLKEARLHAIASHPGHSLFSFEKINLADRKSTNDLFARNHFDRVIHLAAQAGVRYSIDNPFAYIESNIQGFMSILENCRHNDVAHLVYASSSSVYGSNEIQPFRTDHNVDHPVSLYAATKKSNELFAYTYSHLYDIPTTGLRFFTVYGPWGRPDMAIYKFVEAILENRAFDVYNDGKMKRDFTYVGDIVEGLLRICDLPPKRRKDLSTVSSASLSAALRENAPYALYNIGLGKPVELMRMIHIIEETLGKKAKMNFLPLQPGDVLETYADVEDLVKVTGFQPATPLEKGIREFCDWYLSYKVNK